MNIKEIKEPGIYLVTKNVFAEEETSLLVLVTGFHPFLKVDSVWNTLNSKRESEDSLRGEGLNWKKQYF